jgi:hypothetical protein
MIRRALVIPTLCLAASLIRADEPVVHHEYQPPAADYAQGSPDGKYFAATRAEPDAVYVSRTDLDTGILVVTNEIAPGKTHYVRHDFPRLCAQLQWSPDSRYLVMTTVSAGGHSPWHFKAYVYSVSDGTLRYMDDVIGLIVSPDFKFVGAHTVQMGVGLSGADGVDFDHPKPLDVDLDKKSASMKTEGIRKEDILSGN